MKRVREDQIDIGPDLVHYLDDSPFTGVLFDEHENGVVSSEIQFLNGIEDGPSRSWFDSGQISGETIYVRGVAIGEKEWFPNRQMRLDMTLSLGRLLTLRRWDEDGLLVESVDSP